MCWSRPSETKIWHIGNPLGFALTREMEELTKYRNSFKKILYIITNINHQQDNRQLGKHQGMKKHIMRS